MSEFVRSFNYQETPGVNRTARIEDIHHRVTGWTDPGWFVTPPGSPEGGPYDELTYLGTDGNIWKTKIHTHSGFLDSGSNVSYSASARMNGVRRTLARYSDTSALS
jgi:hypothetical protein